MDGKGMFGMVEAREVEAAIQRLRAKGMPINRVNIAEEVAVGGTERQPEQEAPAAAPMPMRGGPGPSQDLRARMKAAQEERNAEVLKRAMEMRRKMHTTNHDVSPPMGRDMYSPKR